LERKGASYLCRLLPENGRIGSQAAFPLKFKGLIIKGPRQDHPLVKLSYLRIGQGWAKPFIAISLLIQDLEPFDVKALDGFPRHAGSFPSVDLPALRDHRLAEVNLALSGVNLNFFRYFLILLQFI
jgi:hypothetical protein